VRAGLAGPVAFYIDRLSRVLSGQNSRRYLCGLLIHFVLTDEGA
jgi:hypothetical protein